MDIEKRIEAYSKLGAMDNPWEFRKKTQTTLFLQKHPHIRAAIHEYAYDHHHAHGQEEVDSAEHSIATFMLEALLKEGLVKEDNDSDDFLQLVLDYKE